MSEDDKRNKGEDFEEEKDNEEFDEDEYYEDGFPKEWMRCPLPDLDHLPMVLLTTPTKCYVGAYVITDNEHEIGSLLVNPLLYAEVPTENPGQLRQVLNKPFAGLSLRDDIRVRYEALIFLNPDSTSDKKLAEAYAKQTEMFAALDCGLVPPTPDDVRKISLVKN